MNPKQTFYEHQANTIIANLKKRQMDGFYCPTCEDAVKKAMELVASGDSVSFGGSMTLFESGIMDALTAREDITLYDRSRLLLRRKSAIFTAKHFPATPIS